MKSPIVSRVFVVKDFQYDPDVDKSVWVWYKDELMTLYTFNHLSDFEQGCKTKWVIWKWK